MTDFKVIDGKGSDTPATTASLAAMEFESVSRVLPGSRRGRAQPRQGQSTRGLHCDLAYRPLTASQSPTWPEASPSAPSMPIAIFGSVSFTVQGIPPASADRSLSRTQSKPGLKRASVTEHRYLTFCAQRIQCGTFGSRDNRILWAAGKPILKSVSFVP
jgi:hypothetical protein